MARYHDTPAAQKALAQISVAAEAGFPALRGDNPTFFPSVEGHPVTHLVLQGGGTLGLAHLGFVYGLEHAGIRFAGLAGTSAGAIVAICMAAARGADITTATAEHLLPVLETMPAATFMDGPHFSRRLTKAAVTGDMYTAHELIIPAIQAFRRLLSTYGLHRGDRFQEWFAETLSSRFDVRSTEDLQNCLSRIALQLGMPRPSTGWSDLLHVVATAMPIGLKVVFPRDASWFDGRYRLASPAIWARASMSVPLFFEPLDLELGAGWHPETTLRGVYPPSTIAFAAQLTRLHFIDGGLLSNFPVDAFGHFPSAIPTISVALVPGASRQPSPRHGSLSALLHYTSTAFMAIKSMRDRDAVERVRFEDPLHRAVAYVDTGSHHWLNFGLDDDAAQDLFVRGLAACATFLDGRNLVAEEG